MSNIDIFSEEWRQQAINKEMELGGIRIGPLQPLGVLTVDGKSYEEESLQREEDRLRQKLAQQLAQMKGREAEGKEYLRKHGIVPKVDVPDGANVYARH